MGDRRMNKAAGAPATRKSTMKVGIIRCRQTEDICPGSTCLASARLGTAAFKGSGPVEVIGLVSCGGCPGKKAVARALDLEERGAEAIFFASCLTRGLPWDFVCPHWRQIRRSLRKALRPGTRIVDWTH